LQRVFEYWRNIDNEVGERIENAVRSDQNGRSNGSGLFVVSEHQEQQMIS